MTRGTLREFLQSIGKTNYTQEDAKIESIQIMLDGIERNDPDYRYYKMQTNGDLRNINLDEIINGVNAVIPVDEYAVTREQLNGSWCFLGFVRTLTIWIQPIKPMITALQCTARLQEVVSHFPGASIEVVIDGDSTAYAVSEIVGSNSNGKEKIQIRAFPTSQLR